MKKKSSSVPPGKNLPRRPDRDRRVRQSERIARVLGVLNLIQSRGRWNVKSIAQELGCSERTVFRDLEVLEFAGVPWYFDEHEQCYRVRPDFRFPTLMLSEEEALGQALATSLTNADGLDITSGAGPTTRKLSASSNQKVQQILADVLRLVEVFDLKLADHSRHHDVIKSVQFALLKSKQVTGSYTSPYESKSVKLTIHIYRLCLIKQAWYVIGRVHNEDAIKTFRVARFRFLRVTDQEAIVPEHFDLRKHFGNAWAVFRGTQSYDVQLRFEAAAAKVVTETIWHHTQKVTHHKDGRATLSFQVDGLEEILNWILSWSGKVKVLAPDELKVRYWETLEAALEMNSQADSP